MQINDHKILGDVLNHIYEENSYELMDEYKRNNQLMRTMTKVILWIVVIFFVIIFAIIISLFLKM